jgi:signal transduction histidine kinase
MTQVGVRTTAPPVATARTGSDVPLPFQPAGRRDRALPFAIVAVVAEASILLPPGPQSTTDLLISAGLLVVVIASFWLQWGRIPAWAAVLVPLTYTGSVLAAILATGQSASGIGIILLIPLIWTALFHRRWESMTVVAAVVVVEIITALTPVQLANAVIARRCFLWSVLGILISIAIHRLRERAGRASRETVALQEQVRDLAVMADRDRIGMRLHQTTIQRISSVELYLEGTRNLTEHPSVNERLTRAVSELDETVRDLRIAIFDLDADSPGAQG